MKTRKTRKWIFTLVVFTLLSTFSGFLAADSQAAVQADIKRLENGLLPPVLIKGQKTWTLAERMMYYRVPGVSIAVIKDYKVLWSKGYGYSDNMSRQPVTDKTLFQMASISKPVTAAAVLGKVQDGKFALHKPVNSYLKSWKLPENKFTKKTKVTIAHLLSHTSGITIPGYRGYLSTDAIPNLLQVLDGLPPVNSSAARVGMEPGKKMVYSGGGYSVIQKLIVDTQKKSFPAFMKKNVFSPLGMTDSTFKQPLPKHLHHRAASGHRPNTVTLDGKWHVYPEMAAAGLWSTSSDMAKFIADIQLAYKKNKGKILSQKMAKKFLEPYISDSMGLGFFIMEKKDAVYFHHSGGNEGFRVYVIGHLDKGCGAVVLTNSDNGGLIYNEIIRGIAVIYKWDHFLSKPYETIKVKPEILKTLTGKFAVDSGHLLEITSSSGQLYARLTLSPSSAILPISETKFVRTDADVVYEFVRDPKSKKVSHIIQHYAGDKKKLEAKPDDYTVPGDLLEQGLIMEALKAYTKLKKENPKDPNVNGYQLIQVAYTMMKQGRIRECMAMLNLTADLSPETMKNMRITLETELKGVLKHPHLPDQVKQQIKSEYNKIMRKLQLPEYK